MCQSKLMNTAHHESSIPGWFDFHDVYDDAISRVSTEAVFVEVGAWFGRSTAYLARGIKDSRKSIRLHVVDTWRGSPKEPEHLKTVAQFGGDLFPVFRQNMIQEDVWDVITPQQMTSIVAAQQFDDESIDFVFLDAAHDPVSLSADIRAWWPKIKRGGCLGGHDYGSWTSVTNVVDGLFGRASISTQGHSWLMPKPIRGTIRHPATSVVLVPVGGAIEPGCDESLRELERRGYAVWRVRGYSAIDAARNQMATDALEQGFDELMWVDSDVVFQPDDVERLRSHQMPITCGLYSKKSCREFAATFRPGTEQVRFGNQGGLIEIKYCGFGFVHTRRILYERLIQELRLPKCNERFGSLLIPFFAPMVVPDGAGSWYLAEDYAFCERVHQINVPVMADTRVRLWHVGNYRFGWEDAGSDKERFGDYTFHLKKSST